MAAVSVEERLSALEKELAQLKQQLAKDKSQTALPWWEKIAGTFADSEEYEEAMRLGREYRDGNVELDLQIARSVLNKLERFVVSPRIKADKRRSR